MDFCLGLNFQSIEASNFRLYSLIDLIKVGYLDFSHLTELKKYIYH